MPSNRGPFRALQSLHFFWVLLWSVPKLFRFLCVLGKRKETVIQSKLSTRTACGQSKRRGRVCKVESERHIKYEELLPKWLKEKIFEIMGSRLISISFDKIYRIVKLCSLNGIFVASPSPLYLRVCILLAVCSGVSVCVGQRGCTLDNIYSFLGDNLRLAKEKSSKRSKRSIHLTIHLCLNWHRQKATFVCVLGSEFGLVGSCGSCSSRS